MDARLLPIMQIEVRLSGFLQRVGLPNGFLGGTLDLPDGAIVVDALRLVGVDARAPWLITHNSELARYGTRLQDHDVLIIVPLISGGMF